MTIREYTPDTDLFVGQWVNIDSNLNHAIAGSAAQIKAIKPSSVVVDTFRERKNGEVDDSVDVMKRKFNIQFVCDSMEEAFLVAEKSREFTRQAHAMEDEVKRQIATLKASSISALVGASTSGGN